jgi:hypothetical protein
MQLRVDNMVLNPKATVEQEQKLGNRTGKTGGSIRRQHTVHVTQSNTE